MQNNPLNKVGVAIGLAVVTGLSACGSSSSGGGSGGGGGGGGFVPQELTTGATTPITARTANSTSDVVSNGVIYNARTAGIAQSQAANVAAPLSLPTTMSYNPANETVTINLNGEALVFDATAVFDGENALTESGDAIRLFANGNNIGEVRLVGESIPSLFAGSTGLRYVIPVRASFQNMSARKTDRVWGVIGRPTPATANLTGTATYNGSFLLENFFKDGGTETDKVRYTGATIANVNFSAQTINGSFNINGVSDSVDTLTMPSDTSLGFSGTVSGTEVSAQFDSATPGGNLTIGVIPSQISGQFFGPNAQEIGGTIYFDGSISNPDKGTHNVISAGTFGAQQ